LGFTAAIGAIGVLVGCAQLLDIPPDPELAVAPAPRLTAEEVAGDGADRAPPDADAAAAAASTEPASEAAGAPGSDGVVPAGDVAGIAEGTEPRISPVPPATAAPDALDAGVVDASAVAPSAAPCEGFERVPIDVVFIVDNSGSMAVEVAAFEQALPAFVERLDGDDVDFRIILLSRHRRDDPDVSAEASTSVCISAPVAGLDACPSDRPVPGPRFFQYSVKIDATDSLIHLLQTFSRPDPFGLTRIGWSEWLRAGSRPVFIEISDADSELAASELTSALSAAAPERFGADPAAPTFVFHSVVGVRQRALGLDIYGPGEPIVPGVCDGEGSNPDNAGEVYQELSRLTGGLRLSICPAGAIGSRLQALATAVALHSLRPCAVARD
jgi:hypothetical protein